MGVQQLFGDVFIHAGYFLGHLDGLERTLEEDAPSVSELFLKYPNILSLIVRLRRVLHEMWLSEYAWQSIEVFAPIYELICEMMALHGLAFADMRTNGASSCVKRNTRPRPSKTPLWIGWQRPITRELMSNNAYPYS